jgi:hypothetical protein
VVVYVVIFCFNGGLIGGFVVDGEEKKHAKTKKMCSGVLLFFVLYLKASFPPFSLQNSLYL